MELDVPLLIRTLGKKLAPPFWLKAANSWASATPPYSKLRLWVPNDYRGGFLLSQKVTVW